jgi:hypothetical protein
MRVATDDEVASPTHAAWLVDIAAAWTKRRKEIADPRRRYDLLPGFFLHISGRRETICKFA